MIRLSVSLFALLSLVACAPSPEDIRVEAKIRTQALAVDDSVSIPEGDLALLETTPVDTGSRMDLCVDATSSDPLVARVLRVKDECRVFVVTGEKAGSATIRFAARGTSHAVRIDVK